MSFKIEDDDALGKHNDIWNKIKNTLDTKYIKPVYDKKHIKNKVKTFKGVLNTIFAADKTPKESIYYICTASINVDSVMRIDKKNLFSSLWLIFLLFWWLYWF